MNRKEEMRVINNTLLCLQASDQFYFKSLELDDQAEKYHTGLKDEMGFVEFCRRRKSYLLAVSSVVSKSC